MKSDVKSESLIQGSVPVTDVVFNRLAVGGTAIGFAIALGTAACLQRAADHGMELRWHWRALVWMALGVWAAFHLWDLVWRAQADATLRNKSRLKWFCAGILLATLAVFLYPITFVSNEKFGDVLAGLTFAAVVLTFVGWMISRVMRGFIQSDAENERP